ncbi:histone acetyltransferase [Angomonas deanei]|uniref:histone acetyltransferase n=1 Tax=Angomonas deanei TaxID=59799 RepID=A0A7G2CKP5_9TRYP|nr:histone acetyltransferase [Angomonas deanei]CAD2218782.1 MOZ/SAS family, putative [Angomonas deanei]|eukprot:EPY34099.1 histone acetyltransferase [Angomonas deanei]
MSTAPPSIVLSSSKLSFSCTVTVPISFYTNSGNHHHHPVTNDITATNSSSNTPQKLAKPSQEKDTVFHGHLLEVRALCACDEDENNNTNTSNMKLFGFVRWLTVDHRQSGWYPLSCIALRQPAVVEKWLRHNPLMTEEVEDQLLLQDEEEESPQAVPQHTGSVPATTLIHTPVLSTVYREITPGMARTVRSTKTLEYLEERLLRDGNTPTTVRYFNYLQQYSFSPWYYAPYGLLLPEYDPLLPLPTDPEKPASGGSVNCYIRDAYLCPFSLRLHSSAEQLRHETRHYRAGRLRPPGVEIYRDTERGLSVFEVNGSKYKTYSRFLFLLGKSFLENKLSGHDVHNYYFYVVCLHHRHFPHYINDPSAMYFAGYFSWEKGVQEYNLACIVTLPCFTGASDTTVPRQLGQFMIALSYEMGYRRQQVGTPERPLSDLGEVTYRRYWQRVLLPWLQLKGMELEDRTGGKKRARQGEEEGGATGVPTTVREIAQFAQLEETDVLKTIVGMGLLHRSSEDRTVTLVLPRDYVEQETRLQQEREKDLSSAFFDVRLLNTEQSTNKYKISPVKTPKPTTSSTKKVEARVGCFLYTKS